MHFCPILLLMALSVGWCQLEPQIVRVNEDQVNNLGENVVLKCITRDIGDFPVVWKKLGSSSTDALISSGSKIYLTDSRFSVEVNKEQTFYKLMIRDAKESDSGTYQCAIVVSAENAITKNVDVIVRDFGAKIPNIPKPSTAHLTDDQPNVAPFVKPDTVFEQVIDLNPQIIQISHDFQDSIADVGDSVEFQCYTKNAKDFPIYWKKLGANGEESTTITTGDSISVQSSRFLTRISKDKSIYELKITDLRKSDSGTYQCAIAASATRIFSKNIDLVVDNNLNAKPAITRVTPSQDIFEEDTISLQCKVINPQNYPVLWMKSRSNDSIVITAGDVLVAQDYRISFYIARKAAIYTIKIAQATFEDTATYNCIIITPDFNIISKSTQVIVYSRLSTPAIIDISEEKNLNIGDTLDLYCNVKNAENLAVYWKKLDDNEQDKAVISFGNRLHLQDERISLYVNHDHSVYKLKIRNVTAHDAGIYQCQIDPSTYNTYPAIVQVNIGDHESEGIKLVTTDKSKKTQCITGYAKNYPSIWRKLAPFEEKAEELTSGSTLHVDDQISVQVLKDGGKTYYKLSTREPFESDSGSYNCLIIIPNLPEGTDL